MPGFTFFTNPRMNRRNFIRLTAAGTLAIGVPLIYQGCSEVPTDESVTTPQLLSLILDPETLKETGERYRNQYSNEDNDRKLVKLILEGSSGNIEDLNAYIGEKIHRDFNSGNMVMVDGWFLSVTEARQCALFSINQTK